MIPTTYPSKLDGLSNQTTMQVSFLSSVTGLKPWTDYIPVKYVLDSSVENSYNTNGYVNVADVGATTALQAWKDYVPVYVDSTATKANSTDVGGYVPIGHSKSSIGSALDLVFTNVSALPGTITFTRASSATYFNSAGVLSTASNNVPRFDYDPATKQSLGLLIEESRTNLLTYSQEFDNAAWTKSGATITADAVTAPDDTTTADKVVESTANSSHVVYQSTGTQSIGTYTYSVFLKPAGRSFIQIQQTISVAYGGTFDLAAMAFSNPIGGATGSVVDIGNGWLRCSITYTSVSSFAHTLATYLAINSTTTSYTGDGTSGIYIWGAQLEAGAFPTSYIPTTAAAVTRAADSAVMTGTNFSSWFNASAGTIYGHARIYATSSNGPVLFGITDGSTNNAFYGGQTIPSGVRPLGVRSGATDQAFDAVSITVPSYYEYKSAGAYQTNDVIGSVNGTLTANDTSVVLPVGVATASIGSIFGTAQMFSGHIKRITYYPTRLSNAQLQAMTA